MNKEKVTDKLEHLTELGGLKKDIILLAVSGVALICNFLKIQPFPFDIAWLAVVLCGLPIIIEALTGLISSFDIKADVLVAMALIASLCIGETFAAGEVAFIMQLGELLEDLTVEKARAGIEKLARLTPQTARVIADGKEEIISASAVEVGNLIRVLPGESIPVDGVIVSGQTSINQAVMTGESMPVDKKAGDTVSSGTVNMFGPFEMKATKVGEDSSIQRMIRLMQSADAQKAEVVGIADRWATWIVVASLTAAILTWLITGQIIRAVTILVVFCPCSLVLATPTAIMAAIGNVAKHGFLVRNGASLEQLSKVRVLAFDKTGTLTYGKPEVTAVKTVSEKYSEADIFRLAASAEQLSEHPLGKAIVNSYRKTGGTLSVTENFSMNPGRGLYARCEGTDILAGNLELLCEHGVKTKPSADAQALINSGCTVVYIAVDGEYAGLIALSDTVRKESPAMIQALDNLGVSSVLLTGDNANSARFIADQLNIDEVHSACLPEDKLKLIGDYQLRGMPVCMTGDGINDAPALKKADVGIAMGGIGSDIAIDAADIVLVGDEVSRLPHLVALSAHMMKIIKLNITFSMILNFIAVALAITGTLSPVVGALVHNAGSVLVITNSSLLLGWHSRRNP